MITIETMKRFTKDARGRYDLENFGWHNGYLCATDARVFIRVKFDEKPDVKYSEKFPDVDSLYETKSVGLKMPIAMIQGGRELCPKCHGTGCAEKMCEACQGEGEVFCDKCCHYYDCKECGGDGYVADKSRPCPICDGEINVFSDYLISDKALIAGGYITLISSLPNVEFYIDKNNIKKPVFFTFDGGDGLIMTKERV